MGFALIGRDLRTAECLHVLAGLPGLVPVEGSFDGLLQGPARAPIQTHTRLAGVQREQASLMRLLTRHDRPACLIRPAPGQPLDQFADAQVADMPYGRKRALEIATTLALEPEMMLLDEPTQGMGREDVERITALIRKVSAGRTILMVEHNLGVVSTLCDRISVLQRGAILTEGDYATVSADARVREAYMGRAA